MFPFVKNNFTNPNKKNWFTTLPPLPARKSLTQMLTFYGNDIVFFLFISVPMKSKLSPELSLNSNANV